MPPRKHDKQAEPAEFPDDAEIQAGANYDVDDPLRIVDPDPAMYYYFAADDGDKMRPDGVHRLTREKGYRISKKEHYSPDCVLLERPLVEWEKDQARNARRNAQNERDAMEAPDGMSPLGRGHRHGVG